MAPRVVKDRMARVLVIEDEAPRLRLMAWFLIEAGHEVASVMVADEAIERVKVYRPDVIIFNTVMEDSEKQRCISDLRALSPHSRILDISEEKTRLAQGMIGIEVEGNLHRDGIVAAVSPGLADAYLRVPFNANALIDTVDRLLETRE